MMLALPVLTVLAVVAGGDKPLMLTCTSPIPADASAQSLVAAFAKANVRSEMLGGAEGETERGTVLFPNDPQKRLEIRWKDTKHQRRPATISISNKSQWKVSIPHLTPLLLGIGASLSEVEEANGKPFKVAGFAWDYGGYPAFTGGRLDVKKGCGVVFRFNPDSHAKEVDVDKVSGESNFSSRSPELRKVRPYVSVIGLSP